MFGVRLLQGSVAVVRSVERVDVGGVCRSSNASIQSGSGSECVHGVERDQAIYRVRLAVADHHSADGASQARSEYVRGCSSDDAHDLSEVAWPLTLFQHLGLHL